MSATALLPAGAVAVSAVAYFYPALMSGLGGLIVPLLGVVMLGMGMTLSPADFVEIARRPRPVAAGACLQFLLMPLLAWIAGSLAGLPPELVVGIVLVGACPGGTASNVICYLARGDVALSIALTTVSTVASVFLTPFLTWLYAGQTVAVPVWDMMFNIARIVLLPVCAGVLINHRFGDRLAAARRFFPYLSVAAIILIIGIVVSKTGARLKIAAPPLIAAVCLHNLLGLSCGYYAGKLLGYNRRVCRTFAIEVGMQNSGLAIALAHLAKFPALAALPGAVFSVWHNVSGSVVAAVWERSASRDD
ncbi:MAG: bile acid:sodium symporter family protein [Candidatus Dadabacteria bacterium]|nr:bile acid:sodium symporter family protein [Candidatus Dadabacteria bacterium]